MTLPSASVPTAPVDVNTLTQPGAAPPSGGPAKQAPGTNGEARKGASPRLPKARGWSNGRKAFVIAATSLLVIGAVAAAVVIVRKPFKARPDLVLHTVQYGKLALTIIERGALESANNSDIYCRVKAGSKNSTVSTTIKWVIDDGSPVKKGDLVVDLDDSGLQEQLKTQKITLDTNKGNMIQTEEAYKITAAQNETDIKAALNDLSLARIDLRKYQEGDFPQALKDVEGRISSAESDLEMQRDRTAWSMRMLKKGYYTVSQAQAEQSKLEGYDLTRKKVLEEKRVLVDPEYGLKKRTVTDLAAKVAQKESDLNRVKAQALAKEVQVRTDRDTKKTLYEQSVDQYNDSLAEIKKCKIFAPQDGMVVYYIPEQARMGGGSQQSIVAQGEPVREGQKLMQIPDFRRMLVNTKVHEALVSRVHPGQPASVRVDAFPSRVMRGHVDTVATVSSQQDWLSADVKVYTTKVAIDEYIEGLKPGMSAEVRIVTSNELDHVLLVPVQAIVGGADMGEKRRCYIVRLDGQTEARDVAVGLINETMAEIREGLKEGEQVVLNPRAIDERAHTHSPSGPAQSESSAGAPAGVTGKAPDGKAAPGAAGSDAPGVGRPAGPGAKAAGPGGKQNADRQKQMKEMTERFRKASPSERKEMLEQIPEQFRGRVKERLKAQGIDVPD